MVAADPEATLPPPTPNSLPEAPAPPKPPPQPKKPPVATTPPKPATPVAPEPEPPKLTQMFTAEERRDYNKSIEDSLEKVRRALITLAKKNLNPVQQNEINLISTFQKQAEQARDSQELTTAVSLAKRAEVLAEDLLSRLP